MTQPSAITDGTSNKDALYESPVGVLKYNIELEPDEQTDLKLIFGPAKTRDDIKYLKSKYLSDASSDYVFKSGFSRTLEIESPDPDFDNFINHWLPRQMLMHGHTNRLTADPQTRNYLQDNMGMSFLEPELMREAVIRTLSQQNPDGSLPDGILLHDEATFNYINQVPHNDHNVWLPICLQAYINETGDNDLLGYNFGEDQHLCGSTIFTRVTAAMDWLIDNRDERGLSYIAQGDWCDPMNMVGPDGKGVSGWLTIATAYAVSIWADISKEYGAVIVEKRMRTAYQNLYECIQSHLWDGDWFIRGISDEGRKFGCSTDEEGRIFLNPQSWAILASVASEEQLEKLISSVETQLTTPYGAVLLAPAFTHMHEHIGRVTQKFPGSAENGAVYNHASIFYIYGLYCIGRSDLAFDHLRKMIPAMKLDDLKQIGQLPIFIPNYYRGAYKQFPEAAGRSSHMFNTGTVSWFYRAVIEKLVGLEGGELGLSINPQLPESWPFLNARRKFRGADISLEVQRGDSPCISVNGNRLLGANIVQIESGQHYKIQVVI